MKERGILRIDCSPSRDDSIRRRLADRVIGRIAQPDTAIIRRDLAATPAPFIDAQFAADLPRFQSGETARSVLSLVDSERLIGELEASSVLSLSTPMHNFAMPAVLKARIDQVVLVRHHRS